MDQKQIKGRVAELLSSGLTKSDVFNQLSGQGVKDSQLAYSIAAYTDPTLRYAHNGKVNLLVTFMFILAGIALLLGFFLGAKFGPNSRWVWAAIFAFVPLLFAWGFYNYKVGAYNAYILLTIIQIPKAFTGFSATPITSSIALLINIAFLAYVWYLREKLFPGFMLMSPKKIKGQYVFEG